MTLGAPLSTWLWAHIDQNEGSCGGIPAQTKVLLNGEPGKLELRQDGNLTAPIETLRAAHLHLLLGFKLSTWSEVVHMSTELDLGPVVALWTYGPHRSSAPPAVAPTSTHRP